MIEITRDQIKTWLPQRALVAHKGDFGRVHIVAGSVGYTGAPYFAAEGAVRSGSGLVYLHVPEDVWSVLAVKCLEAMVFPIEEGHLLDQLAKADAVLIGPGLGMDARRSGKIRRMVSQLKIPLVLDADGINSFVGHIDALKARRDCLTVLTPHEGEFFRLNGGWFDLLDRAATARNFAKESGCVLVLKGHRTVIAFPDGALFVNPTGNPGMAKGGSGDILAGMILSLLGQNIPPKQAVPMAVWLHGRAGDLCARRLGEYGMTPGDMLKAIPEAFLL